MGKLRSREGEPLAQGHADSQCQDQNPGFQVPSYPKACALRRMGSDTAWRVTVLGGRSPGGQAVQKEGKAGVQSPIFVRKDQRA